jgi:hypothetical protein
MIAGVVMSALILLAPDPRVGYLLYPINFFVWAYLLAEPPASGDLLPIETTKATIGSDLTLCGPRRVTRGQVPGRDGR